MNKKIVFIVMIILTCIPMQQVAAFETYLDFQAGVSIPISYGLSAPFHDRDGIDVQLNGYWENPGIQDISGKFGINAGWWVNDDPNNFMSHFGSNFNFSYNRLDFQKSMGNFNMSVTNIPFGPIRQDEAVGSMIFSSRGDLFTVAHLFNYRQGVMPDKQSPFGRLQFNFGIGPALMINKQEFATSNIVTFNASGKPGQPSPVEQKFDSQTDVSFGLMAQLGATYFLTKNIYMKASLDYRYFKSSFNMIGDGITHDNRIDKTFVSQLNYDNNLFGFNIGIGIQF